MRGNHNTLITSSKSFKNWEQKLRKEFKEEMTITEKLKRYLTEKNYPESFKNNYLSAT